MISIILTVYNKEKYLSKCIESCLSQEGANPDSYEIIAINDGSTDNSLAIINSYAKTDKRIHVINQSNQGLSMARNNGINFAKGDYIWFVDADDVISSNAIYCISKAAELQPDVIPIYAKTEGIEKIRNMVDHKVETGKDVLIDGHWDQCGVFWVLKRDYVKKYDLQFMPGVFHEDAEFTPRMLYYARSVIVVPEILYIVNRDPNSITQVPRPKRAFDYLVVSSKLSLYVQEMGEIGTKIGKSIDGYTAQYINNAFDIIVKNSQEEQNLLNKAFYEKRHLLIRPLKDAPKLKYRIEAFLFSLLPKRYVWLYKQMKKIGACSIIR